MHIAARIDEARGDRCSKILLKSGADPNVPMGNGCTPVHIAAQSGKDIQYIMHLKKTDKIPIVQL